MSGTLRVAVDIGGTFTDIVVMDGDHGLRTHKVLSTATDPSRGMLAGLDELDIAAEVESLVHGTTVGLNALLSRTGERIGLVTTAGFEDVLAIGRGGNPDIWSLRPAKPSPLVEPADIRGVAERVRFDGSVERPLDATDVTGIAKWVEREQLSTVGVCLLHAHVNPAHELAIRAELTRMCPGLSVVLSHEVAPEQGEFERASTTVATAYVARTVERYLANLTQQLAVRHYTAPLQVMRSSGGICSATSVARQPIQTILSGPAGGVIACETLARVIDRPNLIGLDIGGTSSDVSLVVNGRSTVKAEGSIAGHVMRMPVVELHTIGAGGGSIARAEAGGLRVGPKSAGAEPGPACYGRGGTLATVTDAQLLLGRLAPDSFLGGRMTLNADAAETVLSELGDQLELSPEETAEGVLAIANTMMANAIRTHALSRGVDPSDFSLVAFGGAGPLHGVAVAEELGIREVLIPFATGVLSAWGMLFADVRHDLSQPLIAYTDDPAVDELLLTALESLRKRAEELLVQEGIAAADREFIASADMRYVGQEHSLTIEFGSGEDVLPIFHRTYEERYGHSIPGASVEFVNIRMAAIGVAGATLGDATPRASRLGTTTRTVRIGGADHLTRVVPRQLIDTEPVEGPVIVLEDESTTLVPPGWCASRGRASTLVLRKGC